MRLSDVLPPEIAPPPGADAIDVSGITAASAAAGAGRIFAGLPGTKVDGAAYIPDAIARGARVVIAGRGKAGPVADGVTLIEVENPRRALALIAAQICGRTAGSARWP